MLFARHEQRNARSSIFGFMDDWVPRFWAATRRTFTPPFTNYPERTHSRNLRSSHYVPDGINSTIVDGLEYTWSIKAPNQRSMLWLPILVA